MSSKICIISGPTASGKTSTAIELAKICQGEVVNFDSLLLYKEINIGNAKPTTEEMDGIIHHLIGVNTISTPLNASDYMKMAIDLILDLHKKGKTIFLVGGSGFYLQAVLYGMFDSQTTPPEIMEKSDKLFEEKGIDPFLQILKENDVVSFERYHANDHYRIRRAVEHFWHNGTPFSQVRESMMEKREDNSNIIKYNWDIHHIYLDLPKDEHFEIIQKRTQYMLEQGLVDEVKNLLNNGFTGEEKPLQSIGYKETVAYLKGEYSLDEMQERINISTRQLAKAQRTWFKKVEKIEYHPIKDKLKIKTDFEEFLKK